MMVWIALSQAPTHTITLGLLAAVKNVLGAVLTPTTFPYLLILHCLPYASNILKSAEKVK